MGGSESKQQIINPEEYNVIDVTPLSIERYGEIKGYQNKNTQANAGVIQQIFQDKQKFEEVEQKCREIMKLEHDSIVRMQKVIEQTNEEFCSTFWNLGVFYELVQFDLTEEMTERQKYQIQYHESEIWHILVSVIAALAYLKSNGYMHNDIRHASVLVNDEGKVKILPKSPFGRITNAYQEVLFGQPCLGLTLAPKQLTGLQNKETSPDHVVSKTDVFNLGLTVLDCCHMQFINDIIDLQNFKVNEDKLHEYLHEVGHKYSPQLQEFLGYMLIECEDERFDVEQLFGKIEELCQQGIQVADRLFELKEVKSQHNGQPPQQNIQSINPITHENQMQQQQMPQQELPHDELHIDDQQQDGVNHVHVDDCHQFINTCNQQYPDIHDGEEKVKRSKHFKDDTKIAPLAQPTEDDGHDPRVKEGLAPLKEESTSNSNNLKVTQPYQCSPEVEKILEEYRLKSKIKQEQIESHLKQQQQQQQQRQMQQQQQQQQLQLQHQQQYQQQQAAVPQVVQTQQYAQQQIPQQQVIIQQKPQQQLVGSISTAAQPQPQPQQQVILQQSPSMVRQSQQGFPQQQSSGNRQVVNQQAPVVIQQGQQQLRNTVQQQVPAGFTRKESIPQGATILQAVQGQQAQGIRTTVGQIQQQQA